MKIFSVLFVSVKNISLEKGDDIKLLICHEYRKIYKSNDVRDRI